MLEQLNRKHRWTAENSYVLILNLNQWLLNSVSLYLVFAVDTISRFLSIHLKDFTGEFCRNMSQSSFVPPLQWCLKWVALKEASSSVLVKTFLCWMRLYERNRAMGCYLVKIMDMKRTWPSPFAAVHCGVRTFVLVLALTLVNAMQTDRSFTFLIKWLCIFYLSLKLKTSLIIVEGRGLSWCTHVFLIALELMWRGMMDI